MPLAGVLCAPHRHRHKNCFTMVFIFSKSSKILRWRFYVGCENSMPFSRWTSEATRSGETEMPTYPPEWAARIRRKKVMHMNFLRRISTILDKNRTETAMVTWPEVPCTLCLLVLGVLGKNSFSLIRSLLSVPAGSHPYSLSYKHSSRDGGRRRQKNGREQQMAKCLRLFASVCLRRCAFAQGIYRYSQIVSLAISDGPGYYLSALLLSGRKQTHPYICRCEMLSLFCLDISSLLPAD